MIKYKINIIDALSKKGMIRRRMRDIGFLPQQTIQNLKDQWLIDTQPDDVIKQNPRLYERKQKGIPMISMETLNKICLFLELDISDVIEIQVTDEEIISMYKLRKDVLKGG